MINIVLIFVMGLVISIFGGYVYQKNQNEEKFKESSLNRITVVGASYIMSFGGVLIIIAIYLFSQL